MITQERAKNLEEQVQAQAELLEAQSAALKLARRAIDDYLNPCGCSDGCGFCSGKVYLSEALAAIDALGE